MKPVNRKWADLLADIRKLKRRTRVLQIVIVAVTIFAAALVIYSIHTDYWFLLIASATILFCDMILFAEVRVLRRNVRWLSGLQKHCELLLAAHNERFGEKLTIEDIDHITVVGELPPYRV